MVINFKWLTSYFRRRSAARIMRIYSPNQAEQNKLFKITVNHILKSSTARWSSLDDFMWRANLRIIGALDSLSLVVGYQPLQAKSGMTYRMVTTFDGEELNSTVNASAVTAKPIQVPINIDRDLIKHAKLAEFDVTEKAIMAISSKVVQDVFAKAQSASADKETVSLVSLRNNLQKAVAAVSSATNRAGNTIIVTSPEALQAVLDAAGNTFEPMPVVLNPIRLVGVLFGSVNLVYAVGCGTDATARHALVTAVGDTAIDTGYVFAPFVPLAIDKPGSTREMLSFNCLAGIDNEPDTNHYYMKVQAL